EDHRLAAAPEVVTEAALEREHGPPERADREDVGDDAEVPRVDRHAARGTLLRRPGDDGPPLERREAAPEEPERGIGDLPHLRHAVSGVVEKTREVVGAVATEMAVDLVVPAPLALRIRWDGEDERAARTLQRRRRGERAAVVRDVLEHVEHDDRPEALAVER